MMWIFQESEQKTNRNNEIGIRLTNAYFYQYTLFSEYPKYQWREANRPAKKWRHKSHENRVYFGFCRQLIAIVMII